MVNDKSKPNAGKLVVYGGSFDPVTIGHLDIIHRAVSLFDRVVVAIGQHPTRQPFFSVEERLALLRGVTADLPSVEVTSFEGLLVDFCLQRKADAIVRGLRAVTDFENELQIAHANADLEPCIDTIFLPTRTNYGFISASLVREIASHGGDVSRYAPPLVCEALARKYASR
ncbi:MAG TPA: pantetheine-phosphate adenylyltransferase [Polyangiaceae bacterium]|jgi:pantetheine-phosphate adenylyltransferase|nr:MAG: Phosphopantetheine adenylyltransferase [Deltaproteobacteria bacterium ADurb.Bin207]HNZ25106.1 pantetheine-phosphate adenylyltransferase [Polyangiaceae bacterium]HOD22098.1 pantetheine-phosphate adenylyltransferase [Polyangiaceae bacterium]HOE50644.1 pantetheine-phosphate adenylyltransferase [Polyangiaceae bacterium]HOH02040.1 pantetheine-phosphate adenylyltransferase [Polyangiaceae bacterium]